MDEYDESGFIKKFGESLALCSHKHKKVIIILDNKYADRRGFSRELKVDAYALDSAGLGSWAKLYYNGKLIAIPFLKDIKEIKEC